jgi:hypothetical protein
MQPGTHHRRGHHGAAPTGQIVKGRPVAFPAIAPLRTGIDRVTHRGDNV